MEKEEFGTSVWAERDAKVSESIYDSGNDKTEKIIIGESKTNESTTISGADISKVEKTFLITEDELLIILNRMWEGTPIFVSKSSLPLQIVFDGIRKCNLFMKLHICNLVNCLGCFLKYLKRYGVK